MKNYFLLREDCPKTFTLYGAESLKEIGSVYKVGKPTIIIIIIVINVIIISIITNKNHPLSKRFIFDRHGGRTSNLYNRNQYTTNNNNKSLQKTAGLEKLVSPFR
jgi:hypothetical protein